MHKITRELNIRIGKNMAFAKFLTEINEWWPKEYTWSQEKLIEIRIDGKKDGLCTEIGPYGFRCDWGRVTDLIQNNVVALKWQISPKRESVPNPAKASDLKLVFKENNGTTTVEFEHSNFESHGDGAEDYRTMMDGEHGWDYILNSYKTYCEK